MFLAIIVMVIAGLLWRRRRTQTDDLFKPRNNKAGLFDSL